MDDTTFVKILIDSGFESYFTVPCSITNTVHAQWEKLANQRIIHLLSTVHEHNLAGLAGGSYFATGKPSVVHMQNSGLPNFADGLITFAGIFNIPMLVLVTWRGDDITDTSEPHQAIGSITEKFTSMLSKHVYGNKDGSNFKGECLKAMNAVKNGSIAILLISSHAVKKVSPLLVTVKKKLNYENKSERLKIYKSNSRSQAIHQIAVKHPNALILFSNGYTSRVAFSELDKTNYFYNIGYMGGTLAMGYSLAQANKGVEVVVVDGDQNAEMSCMKDHLAYYFPDNFIWYILDNQSGDSIGGAESIPLAPWYKNLACIYKIPSEKTIRAPRVKGRDGDISTIAEDFRRHISQYKS